MKYSEQFTKALATFNEAPDHAGVFDSPFWSMVIDNACECIRTSGTIDEFLKDSLDFLDFGICKELFQDIPAARKTIEDLPLKNMPLPLFTLSKWLQEQVSKIKQCDKRDALVKEHRLNQIQISKYHREVQCLKNQRITKLQGLLSQSSSPNAAADSNKVVSELGIIDDLLLDNLRIKKAIIKGVFFSAEQKRENAQNENKLNKANDHFRSVLDSFDICESVIEIKRITTSITEFFNKIIETEQVLEKNQADIGQLEKHQSELSPIELENSFREQIEHIRDLTRLSAKRMHIENCPALIPGKHYFSLAKISKCLNLIMEFDPKIFKNDRVAVFGKPQVVLIPGTGNALYDWKYNIIIIPLTMVSENPMVSISAGLIEYRLDADEDKKLLTSYSQLPEMKTIKSSLQLKAQLTKDYTIWMTSEYQGYRVLPKTVKEWFEHEIGPNKNDIFIPSAYQPFNFSPIEFTKLYKSLEERINNTKVEEIDSYDLWIGSIIFYIQGNYQRSYDLLLVLMKRDITDPMIFYNFGQVASKLYIRNNAIKGFSEFINRVPQCWWARVASDHLRNIQSSGIGQEEA